MNTSYEDWITHYSEGAAQDDVDADEGRDEELWERDDDNG
jgi:hypothetical protein